MAVSETSGGRDEKHGGSPLDDRERAILDFERQWWKHAGAKEDAIRTEFSLSAARYYQVLGALIDRREALVYDPMLVKRLQRLRDARSAARAARSTPQSSS
jgi:hypothetical protein